MKKLFAMFAGLVLLTGLVPTAGAQTPTAQRGGMYVATDYAYGLYGGPQALTVTSGNSAIGAQTITIAYGLISLNSGRTEMPLNVNAPILVDSGSNQETVTPSAVSCSTPQITNTCSITATFSNTHGSGARVASGTAGLQEAINDAFLSGGGLAEIDALWTNAGGTNAMLTAAVPYASVAIEDRRQGPLRFWNVTPTGAALAVPTTLTTQAACDATHQTCSDANVAGSASWAGNLYVCVTYVDIAGNEGPCSAAPTVFTAVGSKAIDIASPAASAGAVGWVPYLSLSGGTYAQAYQIPVTSSVCTMTKLETVTPACAVANTTYGQAASTFGAAGLFTKGGAQITGYPVNTGMHFPTLASLAMTAASQTPVSNSSVTYSYAPSSRVGLPGISSANVSNYAAAPSTATTVPNAIATWTIPAGYFNYVGAEFRVSGKFTYTDGGDSSTNIYVKWDAPGTNTTTVGTTLCNMLDTATGTGAAYNATYTCTVKIVSTGATGTALVNGYSTQNLAAGATTLVRNAADIAVAASGSINLTAPARISVYFIGTGATNNPGAQGLAATLESLN